MSDIQQGLYMVAELCLRLCVHPRLRSVCLRMLGAEIGSNVRVYECQFINLELGFRNLKIGDNVHVGTGCLIDLKGVIAIGNGSTVSPKVVLISHSDPGSSHGSPWCDRYPVESLGITIGSDCWIGASATLLSGSNIADRVVVGAGSVVRGTLASGKVFAGVPARPIG